ncbi:MAG: 3-carboxy-cis,cis-muconate cycloisomerase [Burkholderiales bacterium]
MAHSGSSLLDQLFSTPAMNELFSDPSRVQAMLDFEAALAKAAAAVGVIPATAAQSIATKCDSRLIDFAALGRDAAPAGNIAIPLVKQLTGLVAKDDEEAAKFVHWGATSQDVIDTGLVLQLRDALSFLEADLQRLSSALVVLVKQHRGTLMVGRTWLQHALPITFGLKAAGWLDAITRQRERLREMKPRVLALQFGGAAGTLASLSGQGSDVATALATVLKLGQPNLPWHGHRDRVAEVATHLALLVGALGKIARDISLSMQTEIGELAEPTAPGRGGSSTLPHKRNPIGCAVVLSAAARVPGLLSTMLSAMPQEHERGLGGWHAEWQTLPEIVRLTAGALHHMTEIVSGLEVDAARMKINLDATRGLIMAEAVTMALGQRIGRLAAHHLIEQACHRAQADDKPLREVLVHDATLSAHLSLQDLERLMDPAGYLGEAEKFIQRVLAAAD